MGQLSLYICYLHEGKTPENVEGILILKVFLIEDHVDVGEFKSFMSKH